jgi:hypothetical protein
LVIFSALGLAIVVGIDDIGLPLYVEILFGNKTITRPTPFLPFFDLSKTELVMWFRQELCTHFASPDLFGSTDALYTDHRRVVVKNLVLAPTVPRYILLQRMGVMAPIGVSFMGFQYRLVV